MNVDAAIVLELGMECGWPEPRSTNLVCTSEPSGLKLVRSINGSDNTLPFFSTTLTRPARSTTKMRRSRW